MQERKRKENKKGSFPPPVKLSEKDKQVLKERKAKADKIEKEEKAREMAKPPPAQNDPVLERSFSGHKDTVTSVGFTPNL